MAEGLRIKIGVDATEVDNGIKKATSTLQNFGSQVRNTVPSTTQAFTNLSRVVSDAPFGFIAIQNNIEPLLQSFQQLKAQSGSTGGALKVLAGSLLGSGGVLLAFSAVSSLTTTLIQKYGSLGAALNEFAASSDAAAVRQRSLNTELAKTISNAQDEVLKLNSLVSVIANVNASNVQRSNTYDELKKQYPGVLDGMTKENALAESGVFVILQRSKALINYIQLKAKEAALIKLGAEATEKELKAAKSGIDLIQNQNTLLNRVINSIVGGGNASLGLVRRINGVNQGFEQGTKDAEFFAQALNQLQLEIQNVDRSLFAPSKEGALSKNIPKIKAKVDVLEVIPQKVQLGASVTAADAEINRQFQIDNGITVPLKIEVPQTTFESLRKLGEAAKNALDTKVLALKAAEFKQILTEGLAQPLGDLFFDFLDKGKVNFQSFANTVIASIKRIIAQLAATKIIQLITNLAFPAKGIAGIGASILGSLGGVAAPSFGGLQPGSLGLQGGVALVARGTDLVGVINGANARIGRTG